jgi:exodeoxyribonuclease V alpha subunit
VTRELIYTGVTRARRHCTVVADREQLAADVQRTVERYSGLDERLGWGQEL